MAPISFEEGGAGDVVTLCKAPHLVALCDRAVIGHIEQVDEMFHLGP